MENIPEKFQDLLDNSKKAFAYLATVMPDQSPQITPVWFTTEDNFILINSVEGRTKDRNMRARPGVSILIVDPVNPYRYLQLRGKMVSFTQDESLIHKLSGIYTDNPHFNIKPGDTRITYKILVENVTTYDW